MYGDHEGRRPVERLRKTWLENVEADIAELEIDRRKERYNVIKRKSNPIGKRTKIDNKR